jgi:fumarate reductase flavoprotein subunit
VSGDGPDLVVAGAGGGLVGALRAAQLGLDVVVVEASEHFSRGNNTAMSTAMVPGVGTRWQQEAGVADSVEQFVADVRSKTHGEGDLELARVLAEVSGRLVTWLADDLGLPMSLVTDFQYPGHSRLRCHTVPRRSGASLLAGLVQAVKADNRIDLVTPARVTGVDTSADAVTGARITFPDGTTETIAAPAVLLATNGYGSSPELVREHIPEIAGAAYHGSPESTGDALRIGRDLGAATAFLDAYQGHAALALPAGTLVGWATVMHGGFLVDAQGQRFGDETVGYSEYARIVIERAGGHAVLVLDGRIAEACMSFEDFRQTVQSGALKWGDDVPSLAAAVGVDPDGLARTLAEVAEVASSGGPDRFGRSLFEQPLAPPYAGVKVTPALFHTQGGLRVDEHAAVVREAGGRIPGLYASGGAAAGISGHGAAGYLAGNGLLPALGLAFLAAEDVARRVR